jgi:thymidylate kinase
MLHIIEGANYVGKTTTLEILKKKKSYITFYHPRFNDSQHYTFQYNIPPPTNGTWAKIEGAIPSIHIPRDVVYQISHMTCMKYLMSVKDKKVILDRCFLSEMVYNELYAKQIYHEFVSALKTNFPYKIFLLIVKDDDVLRNRIIERLKKDVAKGFGIRDSKGFVPEPETVEERMKAQRAIENKYIEFIQLFGLNTLFIDTSHLSKKEVARVIVDQGELT